MKHYAIIFMLFFSAAYMLPTSASAGSDSLYMVSLRGAFTPGNEVFEKYASAIVDFRYLATERFDIGLSYEHSEDHVIEMTNNIEKLTPSGEIDGTATSRILQVFSVFHPTGRQVTFDVYFGAGLKYYMIDADDETSTDYDLSIDTPGAWGVSAKIGTHWRLTPNWALTFDSEVGQVYNDYSVKDRVSGVSDDLATPHYNGHMSFGISYFF